MRYFTDDELRCKGVNCGCGNKVILDDVFMKELAKLRTKLNLPMKVNSCCRCKVHNAKVGGKAKSFHISDKPAWEGLNGCGAIDIGYDNVTYRNVLARLAWELGWRIGYHKKFLHLDIAAIRGILPKTIFKYDVVSDAELATFKKQITGE